MLTFKSGYTGTGIAGHPIVTGPPMLARVGEAFVDIVLAARPCVPGGADTLVPVHLIPAGGAVLAGGGSTLVDVGAAPRSGESCSALAGIAVDSIPAGPAIKTWPTHTLINIGFTMDTCQQNGHKLVIPTHKFMK